MGCGRWVVPALMAALMATGPAIAAVVFDTVSPYHHIRVIDQQGMRTLSFDGSLETRMSLREPLQGHFEYIDYFHMPWLWRSDMTNVLMVGLGGGSIQRSYRHYYPDVNVATVEIDPTVVQVARDYFQLKESPVLQVHVSDGRVYLRRTSAKYDAIIMDAYVKNRYGSFIPYHLATREFFQVAGDHLTENGVLAYNVIGSLQGMRADIVGAVYKTLNSVFPRVYLFPARETYNVVFIATKSPQATAPAMLQQRVEVLAKKGRLKLPGFRNCLLSFRAEPPPTAARSPILTDDFAPIDGLLSRAQ
ncbi:MAG TPA: fused MFS/spermidine synthase [Haliangiales bacterium]|nr:fused MFS/spermidine synthase [Haliangiales bacterium]